MLREIVENVRVNEWFSKIDKYYNMTKDLEVSIKKGSIASYDGTIRSSNSNTILLKKGSSVHLTESQDGSMGEIYYYTINDGKGNTSVSSWGSWNLDGSAKEVKKSQSNFK